ncbi:MAG TPA: methyltransferase domain-containing protein [Planctomycetota bacterium]|nr:methyltransferase domain-containing protein [Planctomycetota bacterium]
MRLAVLDRLRCAVCLAGGREPGYEVDPTRWGGGEDGGAPGDLLEGYLVCRACRAARFVVGGVPVLSVDLVRHLRTHGNVYRRTPIGDPRVTRFVLGLARGGADVVPFDEVVARYGDLLPADAAHPPRAMDPADAALDDALRARGARGPALEIGCGVGRGTFVLAGRTGDATGLDRSVARVRRARNVQTTAEFRLPAEDGARAETALDLARLARAGADFAVADPSALPFASGTFATVVVRARDGEGAWTDEGAVLREARRVARQGGVLLVEVVRESGGPRFDDVPVAPS